MVNIRSHNLWLQNVKPIINLERIDDELCSLIALVHASLGSEDLHTSEVGEMISEILRSHLQQHRTLQVKKWGKIVSYGSNGPHKE